MSITKNTDKAFWSRVKTGPRGDCWEWMGARKKEGYGLVRRRKLRQSQFKTHRYVLFLCRKMTFEELCDPSKKVLHKCDNPPCVNPFHLYVGSQRDNVLDMYKRKRVRKWDRSEESNGNAKLSRYDVSKIKSALREESPPATKELARVYCVSIATIRAIKKGKNWKNVLPFDDQY